MTTASAYNRPRSQPATSRAKSLTGTDLGWLPVLAIIASVGLGIVATGYTAGRLQLSGAQPLFWLGLLVMVVPIVGRVLVAGVGRNERILLIVLLSIELYLVKLLHSPAAFTLFDEFHHWRTVDDIIEFGILFSPNNILPASPLYPGLEIVTAAMVQLGVPFFVAGSALIAVAKLLISLSLFCLFEEAGAASRLAGVASVVYMANPSYLFFDAQFSYESLALPLAVTSLFALARLQSGHLSLGMIAFAGLSIGAVVVTHHLTSYFLAIILLVWGVTSVARRSRHRWVPLAATVFTIAASGIWLVSVATLTAGYLAPLFTGAAAELLAVFEGRAPIRELFRPASPEAAAIWEQLLGFGSVIILNGVIPIGVFVVFRRRYSNALGASLALVALGFGAALLGRFTERGAEIAARSNAFVFLGAAYVAAMVLLLFLANRRRRRTALLSGMAVTLVVFLGGSVLALPSWARIPGSYLVSADPRSVEPQGIQAAEWMLEWLGPGNRILTDRTNRVLLATYGRQHPISAAGDRVQVRAVFFARRLGVDELTRLRQASVPYAVVDDRLSSSLPVVGVYAERGELAATGPHRQPMDPGALTKYDRHPGVDRVFDSGNIQIYDLRQVL